MKRDELKYETLISIDIKLLTLSSNKYPSYYDQHSADLIKWPILKSPDKYCHASQFTKHLSFITLEGDTLLQIKNYGVTLFLTSANIYQQIININESRTV